HSHRASAETPLGRTAARVLQLSRVPVNLVPLVERRRQGDR
ncbi:MAG TPA: universal stress protein, partial [Pseudomonas sp.]